MLTASFQRDLEKSLSQKYKRVVHIKRLHPLAGGSINSSCWIQSTAGDFFLKFNDPFRFPQMFEKEASGLNLLRSTGEIKIPEIILSGESDEQAFLILELLKPGIKAGDFWEKFGQRIARMHKHSASSFGLETNNYIGSLHQSNRQHKNWINFFIEERIDKQLKPAVDKNLLDINFTNAFQRLFTRLEEFMPVEEPSLLHGDLWSGNFTLASDGQPCLIDPAVYYGHREMDLAMTKLFGGFEEGFYNGYHEEFPLAAGFEDRYELYNLYPLLVHVNLFGREYVSKLKASMRRYS